MSGHSTLTDALPAARWQRLRARLLEPTLVARSMWSVLAAFVLIWAVLLGYVYYLNKQAVANTPGLAKFGNALLWSLAEIDDPAQARATMAATAKWVNLRRRDDQRFSGIILFELTDRSDLPVFVSPALRGARLRPATTISEAVVNGEVHRIYQGSAERWTLRIIEPKRTDSAFLSYNARFLLPYLLIAMPFVLVPVWLSVRNGLAPLRRLADVIAHRPVDDLGPVRFEARHRELKPLVFALDSLLLRLRHKLDRERAFVQDAAHEVRTPLAVISAQAHVMARAEDAATRAVAQQHLDQAIARTSHLAQQLLDLAALDDGQRPALSDLDIAQWLRQILAQRAPDAMARQIELALEAPDQMRRTVDLPALESIAHNLIDNAVRYGRAGGQVLVSIADHGFAGGWALSVRDDGPGVAADARQHLFERFYRGAGHEATGSGLGLAIVRQAALTLGAAVSITEGLEGRGIGFTVVFAADA